jgi:hypothetical protein
MRSSEARGSHYPVVVGVGAGLGCFASFFFLAYASGYAGIVFFLAGVVVSPLLGIAAHKWVKHTQK